MVTLSGGPLGGIEVDGSNWVDGQTGLVMGHLYRRLGDIAVFCGEYEA